MNDHYYTARPNAKSQRKTIEATIRGVTLRFLTDASVFSKDQIDFGSRLLIEAMKLPEAGTVLDVGCGYGPIGLFASKLSQEKVQVFLTDINERALELARENAKLNGLERVHIVGGDVYDGLPDGMTFDCILCNPPIRAGKAIVYRIFEEAPARLNEGGTLWVVIRKQQGAPSARKKLEDIFPQVEEKARKKGYHIFCAYT